METPENPRAYPSAAIDDKYGGMTLRDKFAGDALIGLLASGKWDNAGTDFEKFIAVHAYNISDAMLAERDPHRAAL